MYRDGGSEYQAEYSVLVKPTAKTKLLKFGIIFGAIFLFVLVYAILSIFNAGFLLVPSAVMLIVLDVFIIWFLWKYTNVEYDYLVVKGTLSISAVYGGRSRKELFSTTVSAASVISACEGRCAPEEAKVEQVYTCVSSFDSNDIVYIVFTNQDGKKCLAYFEANSKMKKLIRFYNSSARNLA
ncbi:MAG: hypothetical protein IKK83_05035 [Clostridia bacterium]|nr:hypothetical protein [Clostridia bacterium]